MRRPKTICCLTTDMYKRVGKICGNVGFIDDATKSGVAKLKVLDVKPLADRVAAYLSEKRAKTLSLGLLEVDGQVSVLASTILRLVHFGKIKDVDRFIVKNNLMHRIIPFKYMERLSRVSSSRYKEIFTDSYFLLQSWGDEPKVLVDMLEDWLKLNTNASFSSEVESLISRLKKTQKFASDLYVHPISANPGKAALRAVDNMLDKCIRDMELGSMESCESRDNSDKAFGSAMLCLIRNTLQDKQHRVYRDLRGFILHLIGNYERLGEVNPVPLTSRFIEKHWWSLTRSLSYWVNMEGMDPEIGLIIPNTTILTYLAENLGLFSKSGFLHYRNSTPEIQRYMRDNGLPSKCTEYGIFPDKIRIFHKEFAESCTFPSNFKELSDFQAYRESTYGKVEDLVNEYTHPEIEIPKKARSLPKEANKHGFLCNYTQVIKKSLHFINDDSISPASLGRKNNALLFIDSILKSNSSWDSYDRDKDVTYIRCFPAYKPTISTRWTQIGGGFQTVMRSLKRAALKTTGQQNYDLPSAQLNGAIDLAVEAGLKVPKILKNLVKPGKNKEIRAGLAESLGITPNEVKTAILSCLMGGSFSTNYGSFGKNMVKKYSQKKAERITGKLSIALKDVKTFSKSLVKSYFTHKSNPRSSSLRSSQKIAILLQRREQEMVLIEYEKGVKNHAKLCALEHDGFITDRPYNPIAMVLKPL